MILKRLKVNSGIVESTNCYIIQDEETKEAMVIDPGGEPEKIIEMLNILEANLKYIYLTHCHGDHIGALKELKEAKGGTIQYIQKDFEGILFTNLVDYDMVYGHRNDVEGLYNKDISLTDYIGIQDVQLEADSRVDDGDKIHIGNLEFIIIHTPGHTAGGSCVYSEKEKLLFSGDTLFHGTWGRTDLPTSSFQAIIQSITTKLLTLPGDTIVYPGHGKSTMIEEERPIYLELRPREE